MADTHPYVGYPWAYALSKWQMELVRFIATRYERMAGSGGAVSTSLCSASAAASRTRASGPPRHLETGIGKEIPIAPADGTNSPEGYSPESAISAIAISDMVECLCLGRSRRKARRVRQMNVTAEHAFIADGCAVRHGGARVHPGRHHAR